MRFKKMAVFITLVFVYTFTGMFSAAALDSGNTHIESGNETEFAAYYDIATESITYESILDSGTNFVDGYTIDVATPFYIVNYPDDRTEMNPYDSRICFLVGKWKTGDNTYEERFCGTGFLISNNAVATAAHTFYDRNNTYRPLAVSMKVYYGLKGDYRSSNNYVTAAAFAYNTDFSTDVSKDYGVVRLSSSLSKGYFGFSSSQSVNQSITVTGYPGEQDKLYKQYTASGVISSMDDIKIYYGINTTGGQSGAPVYNTGSAVAVGIHIGYSGNNLNCATRITPSIYNLFYQYRG